MRCQNNAIFKVLIIGLLGIFILLAALFAFVFIYAEFQSTPDGLSDSSYLNFFLSVIPRLLFGYESGQSYPSPQNVSPIESPPLISGYDNENSYTRTYSWIFKGSHQTHTLFIPKELYEYYKSKPRLENIGNYALSDLDRLLLRQMIESFKEHGRKNGYTDDEIVMNVITFVQSLPYTFDIDTTGYDDYPRFPLETLVDGGGDCEDSAVLAAALLFEMGCDVILIELPNHMAMGIKINDEIQGTFWEYNEERYYYIETTYPDWNIGEVPPGYQNLSARLHPMIPIPQIHVSIQANYDRHDLNYVYYNVRCDIINYGPTTAKNISACIMAEFHPFDFNKAGSQGNEIFVGDIPEGGTRAAEAAVRIPRREVARFSCIVSGDNFDPANAETNIISVC